jgi:protein-L-isoaspartate(D-aspartate) O-methyltransferase
VNNEAMKATKPIDFAAARAAMVAEQLRGRGIRDEAVLRAMSVVPREIFIASTYRPHAYKDGPLPIPHKQTISQPYIVAYMLSLLQLGPEDTVLEVGAGSGYAAAVLSRIVRAVYAIERHKGLVDYAQKRLNYLGYDNVTLIHGDGTKGYPPCAPYEAIVVAAGGPVVPETLKEQLAVNGRLIIPIGRDRRQQNLVRVTRLSETEFEQEAKGPVAFVPLIGAEGWR